MEKNENYIVKKIENEYYLLPFGQAIQDWLRPVGLNDVSLALWNLIEDGMSVEELIDKYCDTYDIVKDEEISKNIENFVDELEKLCILKGQDMEVYYDPTDTYIEIGDVVFKIKGNKDHISPLFDDYIVSKKDYDLYVDIFIGRPNTRHNGEIIVRGDDIIIMDTKDYYCFLYKDSSINEARLSKDLKTAKIYANYMKDNVDESVFHMIRMFYLYKTSYYMIHSSSILYKDKLYLFSAPSGTGKTTHTTLWNKYEGTPIINGDLNLIDHNYNIVGIPWCGTSGISSKETYTLGGIILLGRSSTNTLEELTEGDKALFVQQRFINPMFTREEINKALDFTTELVKHIPVYFYYCTKDKDSYIYLKEILDKNI